MIAMRYFALLAAVAALSVAIPVRAAERSLIPEVESPSAGAIALPTRLANAISPTTYAALRWQGRWLQINLPANPNQLQPISLWATYYHVHRARSVPQGYPLLDDFGHPLTPPLSAEDWCRAALQGVVQVADDQGNFRTFNFSSRGDSAQVNCAPYFSSLSADVAQKVSRVRFQVSVSNYGYGANRRLLVPYRTIAVDKTVIPIGSVIYIPEARGQTITLPTGEQVVHDGFFFAADAGSAIRGNHVDVFVGVSGEHPFPFITSNAKGTFKAYLVQSTDLAKVMDALHRVYLP